MPSNFLELWDQLKLSQQKKLLHNIAETDPILSLVEIAEFKAADQSHLTAVYRHQHLEREFVFVPGGARHVYPGHVATDESTRTVNSFLMARHHTDQELWDRFATPESPDQRTFHGADLPIEGLTFQSVKTWLSKLPRLRLPTEAEWEHAVWAGTDYRFPWGHDPDPQTAWYDKNSAGQTHSVYAHEDHPNALGLIDPVGHVWQFCAEGHASGGDYLSHAWTFDLQAFPSKKLESNTVGFRIVLDVSNPVKTQCRQLLK